MTAARFTVTSTATPPPPQRRSRRSKRPRDRNQLAKLVVDIATGEAEEPETPAKDPAAVELGRKGGLKGGKARAAKLSPERRREIARKAAQARWGTFGTSGPSRPEPGGEAPRPAAVSSIVRSKLIDALMEELPQGKSWTEDGLVDWLDFFERAIRLHYGLPKRREGAGTQTGGG